MISILQEAALRGGEVLRSYFRKNLLPTNKTTHHNIVTKADIESQKQIEEYIAKTLPNKMNIPEKEIGFIGEEDLRKEGKYTFVIDPLDGTSNFASGIDFFAVSIALFIEGKLEYGVVYLPIPDIMFYAIKGKGGYKIIDKKTRRLTIEQLELKKTYFNGPLSANDEVRREQFKMYDKLFHHFLGHIALNAAAPLLCLVADSVIGLYLSGDKVSSTVGISIWDISAGKLILDEAGGIITDWQGKEIQLDLKEAQKKYSFLSCHPDNLSKILTYIK